MSEGVTYADLRFVRTPLEKSQPKETSIDGELTYENIQGPSGQEEKTLSSSKDTTGSAQRSRYGALVLLATGLFLLATTIGLGVRYWQVSRQLQQASRDHAAESSVLARRIDTKEGSLARTQRQLHQAEADLGSTRLALRESWAAGNGTREQLQLREESLRQANRSLDLLQQEKDKQLQQLEEALGEARESLALTQQEKEETEAGLRQASSCQQIGCCPPGWKLFRWKCLWISTETEKQTWEQSNKICKSKSSQLLIVKEPWGARELWDAVVVKGAQSPWPSPEYWIGLRVTQPEWNWVWVWVDGSLYEGSPITLSRPEPYYSLRGKLSNRILAKDYSGTSKRHQYICEKAARPQQPFPDL